MPPRSPGRPKAKHPRDVKVSVRLTEHEAEQLCCLAGEGSLSHAVRMALSGFLSMHRPHGVRDTEAARIRRELRKAKRAATPEAAALEAMFTLEEDVEEKS